MPSDKQQQAMFLALLQQEMDAAGVDVLTPEITAAVMDKAEASDHKNLAAAIFQLQEQFE